MGLAACEDREYFEFHVLPEDAPLRSASVPVSCFDFLSDAMRRRIHVLGPEVGTDLQQIVRLVVEDSCLRFQELWNQLRAKQSASVAEEGVAAACEAVNL